MPSHASHLLALLLVYGASYTAGADVVFTRMPRGQKVRKQGTAGTSLHVEDSCGVPGKIESHPGMMWSGKPVFRDLMPSPTVAGEIQMCCSLAGGVVRSNKFSIIKYSNHSSRPGQPAYLCAAYGKYATLIKGNSSITAGLSSGLPPDPPGPPKPNCNFNTAQACIAGGGANKCFWHDNACDYRPPTDLNCIQISIMPYQVGNICMAMVVFDSDPFSPGPSKLLKGSEPVLGKFNWSEGQLNQYTKVTKYPPQIAVPDGQVYWWSISSGLIKNSSGSTYTPFDASVTYEEIVDGKQTHATGFSYSVSGIANYGIDLSGPGFAGKVTGKTVGVNTPFATAFNIVLWPNTTASADSAF